MKDVQCYELFGGIALKYHAFSFFFIYFINTHFAADNASHALASSAKVTSTFNDEEIVVVIRKEWTPKKNMKNYS